MDGWMRRAGRSIDRGQLTEGVSKGVLLKCGGRLNIDNQPIIGKLFKCVHMYIYIYHSVLTALYIRKGFTVTVTVVTVIKCGYVVGRGITYS